MTTLSSDRTQHCSTTSTFQQCSFVATANFPWPRTSFDVLTVTILAEGPMNHVALTNGGDRSGV